MRRLTPLLALALVLTGGGTGTAAATAPSPPTGSERALQAGLSHTFRRAGPAAGALALDASTGRLLFAARSRTGRIPASIEKIYTTSTALARFGARTRLSTRVLGAGYLTPTDGTWHGDLYLKGAGDPTFGNRRFGLAAYGGGANVEDLALQLVRTDGIASVTGRIVGDESLFDTLRGTAYSGFATSTDIGGPLSATAFDRGLARDDGSAFQTRPAVFSAGRLASAMRALGSRVSLSRVGSGIAPASASEELAQVGSPTTATLIRLTNQPSDNYFAEMLLKGLGARFGGAGSTRAGAAVVRARAASLGVHPTVTDGSGLSRADRSSPSQLVTLLRRLATDSAFTGSLAVAGRSGTLARRMGGTSAAGRCRGKTGTLHDVSNLVGYCRAPNGHVLVFAWLMNGINPAYAHGLQDGMTVALARYRG